MNNHTTESTGANTSSGYWIVPEYLDVSKFDFDWRPDPYDPPYVHQFGTQWQKTGGPKYVVPGAEGTKYHDSQRAIKLPEPDKFKILINSNVEFDFSWHPDETEPEFIWVFGNQYGDPIEMPTIEYRVGLATVVKFVDTISAKLVANPANWVKNYTIDSEKFDWSWHPHPWDPPYIYVWGNQHYSAEEMPTVEYRVPGATQKKYIHDTVAIIVTGEDRWKFYYGVDKTAFKLDWIPPPWDTPYIYTWGNKWIPAENSPTVEYHTPGAVDRKYMGNDVPLMPSKENWNILLPIDVEKFDFTWRPDPTSPPYIYTWGNQWNNATVEPTIEYVVPGAIERKYMDDSYCPVMESKENWVVNMPVSKFDYSWRPDPTSPPYIYVWGNQWNSAEVESTVEYHAPGAVDRKYMNNMVATVAPSTQNWTVGNPHDLENFDFSWRPNPYSPPQIYQWENGGPTYAVPGATEIVYMKRLSGVEKLEISRYYIKTSLADLISEHPNETFWALNPDLDYSDFNFSWQPNEENFRHINVFGNDLSKDTQTYYVNGPAYTNGSREINYVEDLKLNVKSKLSIFYVDMGNDCDQYTDLKTRYPGIQKTRYANSWVDTINRCAKKSESRLFWVLCSYLDYSDFDLDFYPSSWQMGMLHIFGTQYNHWGNTYLVNGAAFTEESKFINIIEHLKNINHVKDRVARTKECRFNFLFIDHGNRESSETLTTIKNFGKKIHVLKFNQSYLHTISSWINDEKGKNNKIDKFVWVTSSICDYKNFDFSWYCDPFQQEQLHVFASEVNHIKQRYGDTFLLNTDVFTEEVEKIHALENYSKEVNYIEYITAKRLLHPIKSHTNDSQTDALDCIDQTWPYTELININDFHSSAGMVPSVWSDSSSKILIGTKGASQVLIPRAAVSKIGGELYDYPYIQGVDQLGESNPLNIIFISNGEPVAEENWEHLLNVTKKLGVKNRVKRVKDVNGRVASQHAAANLSETSWYFLVNGKIKVNEAFDWSWQPDRLQKSKHYIFNVTNPVNGLEYGHQAIVANNKKLTLSTTPKGLDFTLDSLHQVVEMNCGVAHYNTDPWTTWRTAFRESIKLRNNVDDESKQRLDVWLGPGSGSNAEWSQRGAQDGVEYWEKVGGSLEELMKTYDWGWIDEYYRSKYK